MGIYLAYDAVEVMIAAGCSKIAVAMAVAIGAICETAATSRRYGAFAHVDANPHGEGRFGCPLT
jgi:hypothetical protein